jgi:RNA polymerase sigma-70 factor, ECF subfamily
LQIYVAAGGGCGLMKPRNKASVNTLVQFSEINLDRAGSPLGPRPSRLSSNTVERGLKADNRNAQSTVRQVVVDEEFDHRADQQTAAPEQTARARDEDELIGRSLAGDGDAFETLVRRHSPRVFSIVGSFFRRRDMIDDIAQEVFAKAYFSLGTFTLGRSFEAWVAKITVNACYDHLRAQRRRIEQQWAHETQKEDEWFELQMFEVARDRHASSERQRDATEIAERLLAKLDPEDRLVVVLIDRDGFSIKEVSEMTGWGQSKVKVRAFRARRVLRAAMKRLVLSGERMQRSKKK